MKKQKKIPKRRMRETTKPKQKPLIKIRKEAPPRGPEYFTTKNNQLALNYNEYYMSPREKVLYSVLSCVVGALVGYSFFGGLFKDEFNNPTILTLISDVIVMVIAGFVARTIYMPIRQQQLLENRKRQLNLQFRDMLEAVTTSLNTGKNALNAFMEAKTGLANQYEEGAYILKELDIIFGEVRNGMILEDVLEDFGRRSGLDDIMDFANVFRISLMRGGNMRDTIRNTYEIINDKITVQEEIKTMMAGTKLELYMMIVIPVVMIIMIKSISEDFARNFATLSGVITELVSIAIFVAAYFMSKKILDIKA